MDTRDRVVAKELTDFALDQFKRHRQHNPAIARVLDEVVASERFRGELANIFFPIFYVLQRMDRDSGLPVISEEKAEHARTEWQSPEAAELIEREFGFWVSAEPDVTNFFFFFLGTLIKPKDKPETYEEAKRVFALILRMIRLERQRRPN
jgi:hypothetical protein